ncbi:MAG: aminotransferase class V-fold PLP-dependent enzyme [bacterium]|nr:aminotransferase class V-fold PLP-dependent enzyme [bacterium]MDO8742512.1 aminotransferase class V-fold PLP-dependent enzyme [bacterium]
MFWKRRTYLDRAAGVTGNASSPHEEGRLAKKMLEDARTAIARLTEVQSDDIIFTSGATESNALAILGYARALRERAGSDTPGRNNIHILYLPTSHASIVGNAKLLQAEGVAVEALPVKDYRVDTVALAKMLRKGTALVSMDAVCGETGVVWNTREVASVLAAFKGSHNRPLLHVDASQAPLTEKITRAHFGADMLTFDASKVASVRGIGILIAHRTIPLIPFYMGGGQERGLRPGSETPELARSFAEALSAAVENREIFRAAAAQSRTLLAEAIVKTVPNVHIQEGRSQAPHILNLSLPGRDTDYLTALLDDAGFAVSTRSACETDSEDGSRAVFVLTGDIERARATLRVSWGLSIHQSELARFFRAFVRAVAFIDNSSRG